MTAAERDAEIDRLRYVRRSLSECTCRGPRHPHAPGSERGCRIRGACLEDRRRGIAQCGAQMAALEAGA